MKDRGNHSLRDGIIAAVVGGLILTLLTYLYAPLFIFFQNLYEVIRNYLLASTPVPNSILGLAILLIASGFTILFRRNKKKRKSSAEPDMMVQQLQQEINRLKAQAKPDLSNLAGLDDNIKIACTHYSGGYERNKTATLTWREIFSLIAPFLLEHPNDIKMKNSTVPRAIFGELSRLSINDQDYETIKIHLVALGLITVDYSQTTTGGMALFWSLTPKGQALLMELRSVKKE
jgi:hypothetical protein